MAARTPDAADGPLWEEAVIWEDQVSDPSPVPSGYHRSQYVTGKGIVILEDGVVRGIGESRENIWQACVDDKDVDIPPGSPAVGHRVIVGSSPTGGFVGHSGEIAQWDGSAWVFTTPKQGTIAMVKSENELYKQTAAGTPWAWSLVDSGGITESEHKTLRHLIHLAEGGGPWDGFATAPYWEPKTGAGPWDYGYTWWESSGKVKKIIEKTINYNTNKTPSTIVWEVYDTDGSTVLVTVTDTYAYTGGSVKSGSIVRTFA